MEAYKLNLNKIKKQRITHYDKKLNMVIYSKITKENYQDHVAISIPNLEKEGCFKKKLIKEGRIEKNKKTRSCIG